MNEVTIPGPRYTRIPGFLWLAMVVTGAFGLFFIRNTILVPNDAAATIANVQSSESPYRLALTSTLVSQVLLVFFAVELFRLFRATSLRLSTVLLVAYVTMAGIAVLNTILHFGALFILGNAHLLQGFSSEQIASAAYAMIRIANGPGQGLIELFWPVSNFTFGLLVIRSRVAPAIFGYMLMLVAVGFLVNITNKYLVPWYYPAQFTLLAQALGALCILPNILWWTIRGARVPGASDPMSVART